MQKAIDIMWTLPNDTKIFPAEEKTLANMLFNEQIEGKTNPTIKYCEEIFTRQITVGGYSIPSILKNEK